MKKKKLIIAACLSVLLVFAVNAQQGGFTGQGGGFTGQGGGFTGPSDVITVAQAGTLRDDSPVVLRGKIERALGNEKYRFADSTGNIIIEIDRDVWGTLSVNENDMVEISGEIDRNRNRVEVEVKSIRKL